MKNNSYPIYFIVILLSILISHIFYSKQNLYYKTDITAQIGRSYNTSSLKPLLIEDNALVIERLRSKRFIINNFSKDLHKHISKINIRTFRNGDSIILSLITKKQNFKEDTSFREILEIVVASLINDHDVMRENIGKNKNSQYIFTRTHISNKAQTYEYKKYSSYAQIIFLGLILGTIISFILRKLMFLKK